MEVIELDIDKILVSKHRRKAKNIIALADSIKTVGLLHPITVNAKNRLICGGNRLAAVKHLGWKQISVVVQDFNSLKAKLATIDENLIINPLNTIEFGEQLTRRKAIYEELYPETKKGGDRKSNKFKDKKIKTNNLRFDIQSFIKDTASKIGVSPRKIEQDVKIVEKLDSSVRDKLRGTEWANEKMQLKYLSEWSPEKQKQIAEELVDGTTEEVPRKSNKGKGEEIESGLSDYLKRISLATNFFSKTSDDLNALLEFTQSSPEEIRKKGRKIVEILGAFKDARIQMRKKFDVVQKEIKKIMENSNE